MRLPQAVPKGSPAHKLALQLLVQFFTPEKLQNCDKPFPRPAAQTPAVL